MKMTISKDNTNCQELNTFYYLIKNL